MLNCSESVLMSHKYCPIWEIPGVEAISFLHALNGEFGSQFQPSDLCFERDSLASVVERLKCRGVPLVALVGKLSKLAPAAISDAALYGALSEWALGCVLDAREKLVVERQALAELTATTLAAHHDSVGLSTRQVFESMLRVLPDHDLSLRDGNPLGTLIALKEWCALPVRESLRDRARQLCVLDGKLEDACDQARREGGLRCMALFRIKQGFLLAPLKNDLGTLVAQRKVYRTLKALSEHNLCMTDQRVQAFQGLRFEPQYAVYRAMCMLQQQHDLKTPIVGPTGMQIMVFEGAICLIVEHLSPQQLEEVTGLADVIALLEPALQGKVATAQSSFQRIRSGAPAVLSDSAKSPLVQSLLSRVGQCSVSNGNDGQM